jgi:hypothetical protein
MSGWPVDDSADIASPLPVDAPEAQAPRRVLSRGVCVECWHWRLFDLDNAHRLPAEL